MHSAQCQFGIIEGLFGFLKAASQMQDAPHHDHTALLELVGNALRKSPREQSMKAKDFPVNPRIQDERIDLREEAVQKYAPKPSP